MRNPLPLLFVVLAVALVGLLVWSPWSDPLGDHGRDRESDPLKTNKITGDGTGREAGDKVGEGGSRRVAEPARAKDAAPGTAVVRGRCIDALTQEPLAGCKVELKGSSVAPTLLTAYEREHGRVRWQPLNSQVTGRDGRFEFRFVPPPPFRFNLTLRAADKVSLYARWQTIEQGATEELGDIPMADGYRLRGRVIDTDGVPQPHESLRISCTDLPRSEQGRVRNRYYADVRSDAQGVLRPLRIPVAGRWRIWGSTRELAGPNEFEIPSGQTGYELTISLVKESDAPKIRGIVVDEQGKPLADTKVSYRPVGGHGVTSSINTDKQGAFLIRRPIKDPDVPVQLSFDRAGYEPLEHSAPVTWGSSDLKFALTAGLKVEVTVRDGETGGPLEEFAVRCFRDLRGTGKRDPMDPMHRGRHPGGVLMLQGVRRGRNLLMVEPTDLAYVASPLIALNVADGQVPTVNVKVWRGCPRRVVVVRKDSTPVHSSKVELLRPVQGRIEADTEATPHVLALYFRKRPEALRLQRVTTGSDGAAELKGPQEESLVVRVSGPDHRIAVVPDVVFAPGMEPLRVEVASGATLRARLRPSQVLDQFRSFPLSRKSMAMLQPEQVAIRLKAYRPALKLERVDDPKQKIPAGRSHHGVPIRKDGTVEIRGIPPGRWRAVFIFYRDHRYGTTGSLYPLGVTYDLKEGETRQVDLDLSGLKLATVVGKVFINGEPAAKTSVHLDGGRQTDGTGAARYTGENAYTDEAGGFETTLFAGTYKIKIWFRPEGQIGVRGGYLRAAEALQVLPGRRYEQTFQVQAGALRVRVLAPDGKTPLTRKQIYIQPGKERGVHAFTNDKGVLHYPMLAVGSHKLWLWKKGYEADKARADARKRGVGPDQLRVLLATLHIAPGKPSRVQDLVAPAESGY